jgi:DNA-directed RNA polymerase alpha subunit
MITESQYLEAKIIIETYIEEKRKQLDIDEQLLHNILNDNIDWHFSGRTLNVLKERNISDLAGIVKLYKETRFNKVEGLGEKTKNELMGFLRKYLLD